MTYMWRVLMVGTISLCGFGLNAMEAQLKAVEQRLIRRQPSAEQNILKQRGELSCSQELKRSLPIAIAEKEAQKHMYFDYPGSNSPVSSYHDRRSIIDSIKPLPYDYYCGHW